MPTVFYILMKFGSYLIDLCEWIKSLQKRFYKSNIKSIIFKEIYLDKYPYGVYNDVS